MCHTFLNTMDEFGYFSLEQMLQKIEPTNQILTTILDHMMKILLNFAERINQQDVSIKNLEEKLDIIDGRINSLSSFNNQIDNSITELRHQISSTKTPLDSKIETENEPINDKIETENEQINPKIEYNDIQTEETGDISKTIYVTHLNYETTPVTLAQAFMKYGEIFETRILTERIHGRIRSRGF